MGKQGFPEILAPAGTMEALYAALHAKADAVYFGGKVLSARAYAGNFEREDIIKAVALAHQHEAKAYFTLNTLIKNHELKLLQEIGETLTMAKIDAIIIQDMGAYLFLKRFFPHLVLHASTQMTVHSIAGAQRLFDLGFERVVLSRELNLKEIREIMDAVPIEVETFVHGALCYCYSGQCQMSAAYGERSANRGKCAQPCRLPYQKGKSEGYLLSLKDQMSLEHLPAIVKSGIHSLKIEGRMKNPEYVYTVVSTYRKYRDLALSGKDYRIAPEDIARMNEVFSRGQTSSGYFFVRKSGDMIFPEQPKTGKLTNAKTLSELSFVREKPVHKTNIDMKFTAKIGEPMELQLKLAGESNYCFHQLGSLVQKAEKKALQKEEIEKPLRQTGDTPFQIRELEMDIEPSIFIPVGHLKEIRRNILMQAEQFFCSEPQTIINTDRVNIELPEEYKRQQYHCPDISVLVRTKNQLKRAILSEADFIYLEWSFLSVESIPDTLQSLTSSMGEKSFYLAMPTILRNAEWQRFWTDYEKLSSALKAIGLSLGILARTADYIDFLKEKNISIRLDYSLNIWNQLSYQFYKEYDIPTAICLGNEISYASRSKLGEFELVVYGKLATMHTANCLANVGHKTSNPLCKVGALESLDYITDRKGNALGYHRNCKSCSNTLYNPVPLFLADQPVEYARCLRFELLDESEEVLTVIFDIIRQIKDGEKIAGSPFSDFTRGHYSKGVE